MRALAYIFYTGTRNKLQAGEYLFDRPMTIPEVIGKLAGGSVVLHKFTVPGRTYRRSHGAEMGRARVWTGRRLSEGAASRSGGTRSQV